jgi:hypothetical protein
MKEMKIIPGSPVFIAMVLSRVDILKILEEYFADQ